MVTSADAFSSESAEVDFGKQWVENPRYSLGPAVKASVLLMQRQVLTRMQRSEPRRLSKDFVEGRGSRIERRGAEGSRAAIS